MTDIRKNIEEIYQNGYSGLRFSKQAALVHCLNTSIQKVTVGLESLEVKVIKSYQLPFHICVLQKRLLQTLDYYGIRGQALGWFSSYLYIRKQFVHSKGSGSHVETIKCVVPQCYVLRPLLFIIYTNNLPGCLNLMKSILFRDDITVYLSSKNVTYLYTTINNELLNLTD